MGRWWLSLHGWHLPRWTGKVVAIPTRMAHLGRTALFWRDGWVLPNISDFCLLYLLSKTKHICDFYHGVRTCGRRSEGDLRLKIMMTFYRKFSIGPQLMVVSHYQVPGAIRGIDTQKLLFLPSMSI